MSDPRPLASVSLDVDNLWSYMKTHGDAGWERRPSYYDVFFSAALEALDAAHVSLTFFVVGIDAASEANHAALRSAVAAGHEGGNHSHEHEPWLHRYDAAKLRAEIETAETSIAVATGQRPIGFRGPGYSWSPALFEILVDRGYLYDASTLPTFIGPLARAYYFWTAKLTPAQRSERGALFGSMTDALRPVQPYRWHLPSGRSLLEIPVTTMPIIKAPFHLSYLLYLSRYSEALKFFPGMDLPGARKAQIFRRVLGILGEHFRLVNMSTHARTILARPSALALRTPAAPAAAALG